MSPSGARSICTSNAASTFVMIGLLLTLSGCLDRNPTSPPARNGVVRVEVATSGPAAFTGRAVSASVMNETGIPTGGTWTGSHAVMLLPPGQYSVTASLEFTSPPPTRLRFPLRCSWRGGNPKPAKVVAGELTVLDFTADCTPPGGVMVTTTRTGAGSYPNGIRVWIEEVAQMREGESVYDNETEEYVYHPYLGELVTPGGFVSVDLSVGTHVVELRGLPPHCSVNGGSKQTVVVREDTLTYLDLVIRCE